MKKNKWYIIIIRAMIFGVISSFLFFPGFLASKTENPCKVYLYYTLSFLITYQLIYFGVQIITKKYDWIKNTKQIIIANLLLICGVFLPLNYLGVELNFGSYPEMYSKNTVYFFKVNNFLIAILILLYINGSFFLNSWKASVIKREELKKQRIKHELLALKNQINPHFLFNNLNTLTHLVAEKDKNAEEFILQFSNTYRYLLEQKDSNLVNIEQEVEMLASLLYLLQIKYNKNLLLNFDKTNFKHFLIAPLTLQMLIENCIKHNEIANNNKLKISITLDAEYISVKNNKTSKINNVFSTGIGLKNIINRYKLLSDKKVIINETKNDFLIKIPILKNENINY